MAKELEKIIEVLTALKDETIYIKDIEISKELKAYEILIDNRYCPNCYPFNNSQ